ncbi:class I SAM-dependent methyltransferase [Rossellomorea sp. SC111]|uniref:class I SAM-dependent methyltransferase n=1 Tax=Rossellomorea sp. SC111 TaxID=2968985 RepID=UPI00215B330A|nr:class I SAM-dependent methyltransferase [Rossellomorea sp. SC111]MCR8846859.1 class I SAM-dependent methyltransferase [Rossellomorea sp. SC111]
MFVTTCGRTNQNVIDKAHEAANRLSIPYIPREKRSIRHHMEKADGDCLVIGKERLELHTRDGRGEPFFFHPNSASFRIKRLMRGEKDPLIEAADLKEGMSFLDCTLGLASDSIIASHIVGEAGSVTGIEANKFIAHIVLHGLQEWNSPLPALNRAMKRINVLNGHFVEELKKFRNDAVDVVYIDPMFEEALTDSHGINPIRQWASYTGVTKEGIEEAKRVAKKRVVLKEHYQSPLFEEMGFEVLKRPSAKFHFGVIRL